MEDCSGLALKLLKTFDQHGKIVEITVSDTVRSVIEKLADAYTVDGIEYAETEMVSPGIPTVRYLSNGDPGYPGEDPEFETLCPHCEEELFGEPGDICRCDICKRFIKIADIVYDEY
jgi:hypothetical protein